MKKTYTLELTLEDYNRLMKMGDSISDCPLRVQLGRVLKQMSEDNIGYNLRLPWKVNYFISRSCWDVFEEGESQTFDSNRAAHLKAAAPELLDAVNACAKYLDRHCHVEGDLGYTATRLIERALRKINTGVPEEK